MKCNSRRWACVWIIDYAGDLDDRKSTLRLIFFYGSKPIAWNCCKQKVIALSSCEAEYIVMGPAKAQRPTTRRRFPQDQTRWTKEKEDVRSDPDVLQSRQRAQRNSSIFRIGSKGSSSRERRWRVDGESINRSPR